MVFAILPEFKDRFNKELKYFFVLIVCSGLSFLMLLKSLSMQFAFWKDGNSLSRRHAIKTREGTYKALSPPLKPPSTTKAAIASANDVKYAAAVLATGISKSAFLFGSSDS